MASSFVHQDDEPGDCDPSPARNMNEQPDFNRAEENELDNRNQQRTFALAGKVSTLRSLALDMENEAYEHNRLLDGVGNDFTSSESLMGGSVNRVKNLLTSGRQNRKVMMYMAMFIILFIFMVWFFSSRIFSGE